MNKVVLIGRLSKDPDLSFIPTTGTAVAKFSLAVTRAFKKEETDFINCKAFGKTAETISQYLTKGRQVAITGSIQTGSYIDKEGTKRYTTEVVLDGFYFIGNNGGKKEGAAQGEEDPFANGETLEDGEMPF